MRKIISLLVISSLALATVGCGAGSNPTSDEKPLISPGGKGAKGGGAASVGAE